MERWSGRVAVVTGASSGIGAAIAAELTKKGLKVVGLARRVDRMEELSRSLESATGKLYAVKCDIGNESDVLAAFKWVKDNLGGVDILINNAAVATDTSLTGGSTEELKKMLDVNVLALSVCTIQAFQSMKEKGVDDGHIIHINSMAGHIPAREYYAMYFATKHAVTALTEGLRRELVKLKSKIRVTSVSPGLVKTEMPPQEFLENYSYLNPEDIADGVLYVLGTPPHVQDLRSTMERWSGRVAVVTGASSGIGAAIAAELTKKGLKVVGLARRVDRMEELSKSLESASGKLFAVKCDVNNESDVQAAFKWVKDNLGGVDILINNAARGALTSLTGGSTEEIKKMLEVNVLAVSVCTIQAFQSMRERGVDDGHIIHINSTLGHIPPGEYLAMYSATKHAVTALTEGLRQELVKLKSKIRVTSVSPGLVKTEMPPQEFLENYSYLNPEDIADGVVYVLGTPPNVQVLELSIIPNGESL